MRSMYQDDVVSVWLATDDKGYAKDAEVLTDLCGLESYDIDSGEGWASDDGMPTDVAALILPLSYAKSYVDAVVKAAQKMGIEKAIWSVVQYDFAYDPKQTVRPIAVQPKFIGTFKYIPDPLPDWAK
jgi:hypothetical protein